MSTNLAEASALGLDLMAYNIGMHRDNRQENGSYYIILGFMYIGLYRDLNKDSFSKLGVMGIYRDNSKENGSH